MKATIDTKEKTIILDEDIKLSELISELTKLGEGWTNYIIKNKSKETIIINNQPFNNPGNYIPVTPFNPYTYPKDNEWFKPTFPITC